MSVTEAVYSSPPPNGKARTLAALTANCHFSQPKRHLGSKNPPILPLEPTSLVLDELHLLLRIGDVLLRNLILHADSLDQETYMASGRRTDNHIRSLELHIKQCGVSFSIALVHNNILLLPTPMCVYIYLSGREREQQASLWTVHLDSTDKERQTKSSQEPPHLSPRTPPLS
jgi:hypothetical protein